MKRKGIVSVIVVALVLAGAFAANSILKPAAKPGEKVRLMLDWTPNTNHTGIYVALDKGWFSQQGIELEVIAPAGVSVESVVGAGKADFGVSFQEYVTYARVQKVPIVSIAAVIQHNTSGFASLRDKGINRAAGFAGKRYGGYGLPIEKAIIGAMMQHDGVRPDSVKYVNVGEGDLLAMLGRDVDFAWIYYGVEGIEAKQRGLDIRIVMMSDYFDAVPDYYTPVMITSERLIHDRPELAKKFMAALSRGYEYAAAHPKESAAILLKHVPELSPSYIEAGQKWLSPRYAEGAPQWGYQSAEVWKRFGDWLSQNGLITGAFDYREAFTNEFLPAR